VKKNLLGLSEELYEYLLHISVNESAVLSELRQETAKISMAFMQIPPEQGQFLAFLIKLTRARYALELGAYTGYSSIWIATALPSDGKLVACDINDDWTSIAKKYWEKAGIGQKVEFRLAPAQETMENLLQEGYAGKFDFIFIDADKGNYFTYYKLGLQLLAPHGLIAVDNVFLAGRVADLSVNDAETRALRHFNKKVYNDPSVDIAVVPIADGLTLIRKKNV
jgi:predicted O-methyltransferase YrrM